MWDVWSPVQCHYTLLRRSLERGPCSGRCMSMRKIAAICCGCDGLTEKERDHDGRNEGASSGKVTVGAVSPNERTSLKSPFLHHRPESLLSPYYRLAEQAADMNGSTCVE
jgi:hypothetical protein